MARALARRRHEMVQPPETAGRLEPRRATGETGAASANSLVSQPSAEYERTTRKRPMSAENRLKELNLQLPPPPKPVGVYKSMVVCGDLAYASGHGPIQSDGSFIVGRVGQELDLAAGKAAARQTGLTILATARRVLGSLDKIQRVIKVFGMVNCAPEFRDHPQVINGCSELFAEIWGPEDGIGARSAVGMNSLPSNIAVEIEVIFALQSGGPQHPTA
jgi:enamine deaminase RidA (YjgF/YER057c/UK114 family)